MAGRNPRPGDIYTHFKGNPYQVVAIAYDERSNQKCVVYQALYGDYKIYVRDYEEFISEVDKEKYPQVQVQYRFSTEEPSEIQQEKQQKEEEKRTVPQEILEEETINPDLLAFLDAEAAEEKIAVLNRIHGQLDERMLSAMEASLDLSNVEGSLEDRVSFIRNVLKIRVHYEGARLRKS